MKGAVLILFLMFLVLGISVNVPVLLADEDDNRSGSNSGNNSNSITDNSGSSDDNNENETSIENDDDKDESRIRERTREITTSGNCTIKTERRISVEDGKRVESFKREIECADGRKAEIKIKVENRTEDGRFRERIRYEIRGEEIEVEVEDEIDLEEETNGTEYRLKARLRNGNVTDIKIMPDQASEIALDRLRALNFTVELREATDRNVPRVVYIIETNKHGRFLGVFKLVMKVEGQVDPETGEFIGISKPWWAFLVAGEDAPDEELFEGELEIKAETFNGTSEVKVELEFGTEAAEQAIIVEEILNRLSGLNVSNLLEIEEGDEAIEDGDKMEAEAEIEEGFTEVEFEWKFVIGSDDRESIIGVITTRLSQLTAEDINSAISLEVDDVDEGDEELEDEEDEIETNSSG